jgi:putative ABC transport system permease protein
VVRQIAAESLAQGVLGGVLGVVLGLGVALLVGLFGPTLSASSTTGGGDIFGVQQAARTTSDAVSLSAPVGITILLAGFALAVVGGLLAGAAGAFRAARLRPADALRTVE